MCVVECGVGGLLALLYLLIVANARSVTRGFTLMSVRCVLGGVPTCRHTGRRLGRISGG